MRLLLMIMFAATVRPDISGAQRAVEEPGPCFKQAVHLQQNLSASGGQEMSPTEAPARSAVLEESTYSAEKQAEMQESVRLHEHEDAAALEIDPTPAEKQSSEELPHHTAADTLLADAGPPPDRS